jgi:hypothetical protein
MSERTEQAPTTTFDPAKYLVNLNGKGEYLEVKWRLLWLRTEHPEAIIETELVKLEDRDAVFKARVTIPGGGSATGWGSESASDFRDFLEKAETKSIGRALAALGYGTQFCHDHEFGADGARASQHGQMRLVDTPVEFNTNHGRRQATTASAGVAPSPAAASDPGTQRATERQVKFIYAIAREAGLDEQELAAWSQELYSQEVDQLNRRDASTLIEALQRRRNEVA